MVTSEETEESPRQPLEKQSRPPYVSRGWTAGFFLVVVAAVLAVNVWLVFMGGGFRAELANETDAPAHYVTALMVRDYVAQGFPTTPLAFAKNYYLHYPRIAMGHWPPVFYVLQAAWMLVFGVSRTAILGLILLITALLAASLCMVVRRACGPVLAGAATVLFVCIPLVQAYSGMVMADMLIALISFWAILVWARYMEAPAWPLAIGFAFLSITAIMTKGNGFALAFVPPISILLCRRWDLLKRRSLHGLVLLIALICLPWHFATRGLLIPTMQYSPTPQYFATATWFFLSHLLRAPGVVVALFAFAGVVAKVINPYRSGRVEALWGAALAQIVAVQVFYSTVPGGMELRYLLASLPMLLMFGAAGIQWVSGNLNGWGLPTGGWVVALSALTAAVFFATVFEIPKTYRLGFQEVAEQLTLTPELRNSVVLCASDANGEGALISEVAMREARPGHVILRASKMLAEAGWNGDGYKLKMETPEQIRQFLEAAPVEIVVIDLTPGHRRFEHQRLLQAAITGPGWERIGAYPATLDSFTAPGARVEVWRQQGVSHRPAPHFTLEMSPTPQITLVPGH
jgi:hypothetical protein